jgi:hypothetical protein
MGEGAKHKFNAPLTRFSGILFSVARAHNGEVGPNEARVMRFILFFALAIGCAAADAQTCRRGSGGRSFYSDSPRSG